MTTAHGRREPPTTAPDILTTEEACDLLGVSEPVLRDAMRRQGLPYRRVGAKVLRFSRAALVGWVAAGDASHDLRDDDGAHPWAHGPFSQTPTTAPQTIGKALRE